MAAPNVHSMWSPTPSPLRPLGTMAVTMVPMDVEQTPKAKPCKEPQDEQHAEVQAGQVQGGKHHLQHRTHEEQALAPEAVHDAAADEAHCQRADDENARGQARQGGWARDYVCMA